MLEIHLWIVLQVKKRMQELSDMLDKAESNLDCSPRYFKTRHRTS
jgi:hypothetical protein